MYSYLLEHTLIAVVRGNSRDEIVRQKVKFFLLNDVSCIYHVDISKMTTGEAGAKIQREAERFKTSAVAVENLERLADTASSLSERR